jgi:hypothetical protein
VLNEIVSYNIGILLAFSAPSTQAGVGSRGTSLRACRQLPSKRLRSATWPCIAAVVSMDRLSYAPVWAPASVMRCAALITVSYSHLVSVVAKMTGTLGGTYGEGTLSLEAAVRQRSHCDAGDTAVLHLV